MDMRLAFCNSTPGRRCGKARRLPFAHDSAHSGAPRTRGNWVACDLFGGADFQAVLVPTVLKKIGGTENPCGNPLAPGSRARCAKGKAVAGTERKPYRRQGWIREMSCLGPCCRRLFRGAWAERHQFPAEDPPSSCGGGREASASRGALGIGRTRLRTGSRLLPLESVGPFRR